MQVKGKVLLSLALIALAAVGCGKSRTDAGGSQAGEKLSPADIVINNAIQKIEGGDVTSAVAVLEKGLAELAETPEKGRLFALEMSMLLNHNLLEDAQARYLKALSTESETVLARNTLGFIEDYLSRQPEGHSNVLVWCDRLEAAGLPAEMKTAVLQNRLSAHLALGHFDESLSLIETKGWALSDDIACAMCNHYIQTALGAGKLDEATAAIVLLEGKGVNRAGMAALAVGSRIDLELVQGRFVPASDLLFDKVAIFDDGASANMLDKVARAALGAGKVEDTDAIVEKALTVLADRPAARSRAALWWVMRARDAADLDMAVNRLEKLDAMGLPPGVLVSSVNTVSQLVLAPATPSAAVTRLMGFIAGLKARVTQETDTSLLAGIQLDGGFRTEDYAGLVKVLESGVAGHDAAWHNTMINKVKAHLALQEGHTDEAVKRFRDFMASIAADKDQGHRDPVTDERVTKEMILGFNARRIGDILRDAKRPDDAAKAYAEAREKYRDALKGFVEKDPETTTVKKILEELDAESVK
jgi:tetratricopeptide (TPR) repeat protein